MNHRILERRKEVEKQLLTKPYFISLLQHAAELKQSQRRHSDRWRNYEKLKRLLMPIAGWHSKDPETATSDHYDAGVRLIAKVIGV